MSRHLDQDRPLPPHHYVERKGKVIKTNHGMPVDNDDVSLKAGPRGPILIRDTVLREKITHFDHERIPERVVHARGTAAHGFFTCTSDILRPYTDAELFTKPEKRTSMFVRFSTVLGSAGSADCARDVRGFAMRFYTEDGNFDLVGNNIPVFFVNDGLKFPDLVHAAKPEPDSQIPQAATAHDTAWDFFSMHPEAAHTVMFTMTPRGTPYSFAHMQGFGVHTFRLVKQNTEDGTIQATNCKFIWKPRAGLAAMTWNECQVANGSDPDFHRRKLTEVLNSRGVIEYDFYVQILPNDDQIWNKDGIEILDATKFVSEELYPLLHVGIITLNRAVDNFFSETEQVAFCPSHIIKGIELTDDPLLHSRLFSYLDTQLSRIGVNFMQLPINQPRATGCPFLNMLKNDNHKHNHGDTDQEEYKCDARDHASGDSSNQFWHGSGNFNNYRDGQMQMLVHTNKIAYQPNALHNGEPHEDPNALRVYPQSIKGDPIHGNHKQAYEHPTETRKQSETFGGYYIQAKSLYHSLTPWEKAHTMAALVFELQQVKSYQVRTNVIHNMLLNVDTALAQNVATKVNIKIIPHLMEEALQQEVDIDTSIGFKDYHHYISPLLSFGHKENKVRSLSSEKALIIIDTDKYPGNAEVCNRWIQILKNLLCKHYGMIVDITGRDFVESTVCKVEKTFDALSSIHYHTFVLVCFGLDKDQAGFQKDPHLRRLVEQGYHHGKPLVEVNLGAQQGESNPNILSNIIPMCKTTDACEENGIAVIYAADTDLEDEDCDGMIMDQLEPASKILEKTFRYHNRQLETVSYLHKI